MKLADMILIPLDHKIGDWLYATFKIDISYSYRHNRAYERKLAKKGRI